ncbi:MAG TPA: glycosyl hydrolase family 88 [Micromonosporaceae bacterium]|nr:glycosyl hydrolase family 88 [Micromonosporaceae bacterium]
MKRRHLLTTLGGAALGGTLLVRPAFAADPSPILPSRAEVIAKLRLVNDHWINGHSNPGNNGWARATYFSGNMAAYRATNEVRYLQYARKWGQQNNFALSGGVGTRNADNHCAGQTYYDLYDIDRNPSYLTAINESIRLMVEGGNQSNSDWWWCDALHMAMPVFVRVGAHRGDNAYLNKMYSLYSYTKKQISGKGLYNYTDELWFRDSKFIWPNGSQSHSPNGQKVYWSRGNGWALAAHAKVIALLPPGDTRWPEYQWNIQGMGRALRTRQRLDGFWNVNLGDPQHYPGPETSGTAFFTYGLAYGVRTGLLDSATYLPIIAKAWNGMVATAVHPNGFLGYVQGVGQRPSDSQPVTYNTTSDFGVGAFLMAASEVARLTT